MLQWMGGSRRKVYASRKSTQSRQKQYFEQKKRQQQRPGIQNQIDRTGRQVYQDEEPRSLDVLSLNNLSTPNSYRNRSEDSDGAIPQVDCTISNASPIEVLEKTTSVYNSKLKEASKGSQSRLSPPFGRQDVATAVNSHEELLGSKISPSKIISVKQRDQNEKLQGEISLIDLVNDEESKNKSTARPAHEGHVAFSVKGLGHVEMETPPYSPRSTKRILPSPPKATRYVQTKVRRSIPFDATKELDSIMNCVNMLEDRRQDRLGSVGFESGYERSKQFNCYFSDPFGNLNYNPYPEDEDMFCEPETEKGWQPKHGNLDGNLIDENSDRLWKIDPFNSEDHFANPRVEQFDTIDYSFKDGYSPKQRTSIRTSTRFETSGVPSSHDPLSRHSLMDYDDDTVLFDWKRHPPIKKIPNSNSIFGPSAWSFNVVEDSVKRTSPLSEESCSSAAVMENRSYKKHPLSVKCNGFHISLDKLDMQKVDGYLDGISLFSNLGEVDHKRATDQNNLETSYCPEKTTEQQRTREPSCRLSLMDKLANWTSPTSHLKGGTGPGSTERTPALRIPPVLGIPNDGSFRNGMSKDRLFTNIHLQKSVSDIFGDKTDAPDSFCGTDLWNDIDMNTSWGQRKVSKKKEEKFETSKSRDADIFLAKKSVSSVSHQTSVCQHNNGSGQDSLSQGFIPGIRFQNSGPNSFQEECRVSGGTFRGDLELSIQLTNKNAENEEDKIEMFEKANTEMLTEPSENYRNEMFEKADTEVLVTATSEPSENCRNEMSETEVCSDALGAANYSQMPQETSSATAQITADVSCLQETSAEMVQVHAHVKCVVKEKLENSDVDFKTPFHLSNKLHNVEHHSKSSPMLQSPSTGEKVGIEKKKMASMSSNNCDVQYRFMLEHRVLRRLCVQKIPVDTPVKNKLHMDKHFRKMEDGSYILPRSV